MNRRSFFKMITGFVGGVVASFLPGKSHSVSASRSGHPSIEPSGYPGSHSPSISSSCSDCFNKGDCDTCPIRYGTPDQLYEKRSGTKFIADTLCDCNKQVISLIDGRTAVFCPHKPPYLIEETNEGGMMKIEFFDRHRYERTRE